MTLALTLAFFLQPSFTWQVLRLSLVLRLHLLQKPDACFLAVSAALAPPAGLVPFLNTIGHPAAETLKLAIQSSFAFGIDGICSALARETAVPSSFAFGIDGICGALARETGGLPRFEAPHYADGPDS